MFGVMAAGYTTRRGWRELLGRLVGAALAATAVALAASAGSAHAATITVTTTETDDVPQGNSYRDGKCSLIEAIERHVFANPPVNNAGLGEPACAPADPGANTIVLQANAVYSLGGTYQAVAGQPWTAVGLPTINSGTLTIVGNGATIRAGDNTGKYRAMYVGGTAPASITLSDLTIADFRMGVPSTAFDGVPGHDGVVYADNSSVTLNRVAIRDNKGTPGQRGGGGVIVRTNGQNQARVNVSQSEFIRNEAYSLDENNANGGGLAIYALDSSQVTSHIVDSRFTNNIITNTGGGLGNFAFGFATATMTVENTSITGNRALGVIGGPGQTEGFGGGLANFVGRIGQNDVATANITVRNTTISGNRAEGATGGFGGGFFHEAACRYQPNGEPWPTCGAAIALLDHVTLVNNAAGYNPPAPQNNNLSRGGGIYMNDQASRVRAVGTRITIRNSIIADNKGNTNPGDGRQSLDCIDYVSQARQDNAGNFAVSGVNISSETETLPGFGIRTCNAGFEVRNPAELRLGALTAGPNGTLFHPISEGSVALDRVTDSQLAIDQIRTPRPQGRLRDVGAIEAVIAPPVCTPAPRVTVNTVRNPNGGLLVTIRVDTNPGTPNTIRAIRFDQNRPWQNAVVSINGQNAASGSTVAIAGQREVHMVVTRQTPNQPTTVHFTVVHGCGEWQTFVGGGVRAGF